jgi:pimeloyl-ACP methyl ester carboxylesterase
MARAIRSSGKLTTFTDEEMDLYREAWARPGALRSMINWYRAFVQYPPKPPENPRLRLPVLMIWGMQDVALSSKMAQMSIDLCDNGRLVTIPEATHWVQHDAAEQVTALLLEFLQK